MGNVVSIPIGTRFGRLTILNEEAPKIRSNGRPRRIYRCKCDCGEEALIQMDHLRSGHTQSCGCFKIEMRFSHRMTHSRVYKSWQMMVDRVTNPKNPSWHRYGGRGISLQDDWRIFENFYRDMGERPDGKSLDRIDNEKGYSKENCQWATKKEQQNNMENTIYLTYEGQKKTISQWAECLGVKRSLICGRLHRGWTVNDTLNHDVKSKSRNS